jgi:uncharacterized membrane protein
MHYIVLMFVPLAASFIGGGFIIDENKSRRVLGFALVIAAAALMIAMIIWQILDPAYFVLD